MTLQAALVVHAYYVLSQNSLGSCLHVAGKAILPAAATMSGDHRSQRSSTELSTVKTARLPAEEAETLTCRPGKFRYGASVLRRALPFAAVALHFAPYRPEWPGSISDIMKLSASTQAQRDVGRGSRHIARVGPLRLSWH